MGSCIARHFLLSLVLFAAVPVFAQVEGIRDATGMPLSVDTRLVYGRVSVEGLEPGAKPPQITITLFSQRLQASRTTLDNEGYYYFRDLTSTGGTVVVEVNGSEVARQTLLTIGPRQQRVDFFVTIPATANPLAKPGTVDAKYAYERTRESKELFNKAAQMIENGKPEKAVPLLKKVVAADSADFAAWTILGAAYSAVGDPQNAEHAYLAALNARPDAVPTLISLGKHYLSQKKIEPAVETLEKATAADPASAVAFRYLGEAYLLARRGSKGVPALNEAIRLQPVEMAECHLMLARLYDVVGAKHLASQEFKWFLEKVPGHPEKAKMEAYIRDNPIQ